MLEGKSGIVFHFGTRIWEAENELLYQRLDMGDYCFKAMNNITDYRETV